MFWQREAGRRVLLAESEEHQWCFRCGMSYRSSFHSVSQRARFKVVGFLAVGWLPGFALLIRAVGNNWC